MYFSPIPSPSTTIRQIRLNVSSSAPCASHLDAINLDIYVVFVVEADETLDTRAFVCRVWVVPNHVLVLLVFDGEIEVPSFIMSVTSCSSNFV